VVRAGVEAGVGDRVVEQLRGDPRAALLLGLDRKGSGHVSTDRVSGHRDPRWVEVIVGAVLGNPLQRDVDLFEGFGIPGLR
jgi:hypothetical protein